MARQPRPPRSPPQRDATTSGVASALPEEPFQIKPCAWYLKQKDPSAFAVARPNSFDDMSQFRTVKLRYLVNAPLATVWSQYLKVNPLQVGTPKLSRIVAASVPSLPNVLLREHMKTAWPGFKPKMKIFVDMMDLPWGVTTEPAMMVALEIIRIDSSTKKVVLRYLEGTPAYGEHVIQFEAATEGPGVTAISHDTWFRCYGKVLEALYPPFHKKMTNDLHVSLKQIIEGEQPT